jgi:hypothetical protein
MTRAVTKATGVGIRVIRKAVVKAPFIPVESEQPGSQVVASPEIAFGVAASEEAKAPDLPGAEDSGEKPTQAVSGLKPPPILLEGDEATSASTTGPGQKYALGPAAAGVQFAHEEAALPEAYGTGKLLLAARDPHWLYAHWDLTPQQQRNYNALSDDRHLVVRVYPQAVTERPVREVHVHPESRHWFVHVDRAETQYVAELGYYPPGRQWVTVATSPPTVTPVETVSTDQTVRFATIPAHVPLSQLAAPAKPTVPAELPSIATVREGARAERFATIPGHVPPSQVAALVKQTVPTDSRPIEAAMERALAELVGPHVVRQEWISSEGVGEVVRGRGEQEVAADQIVQPAPAGGEAESVSSPSSAPEQRPGGFWFSINAELILYGATEPDATVTIGGRPIQLRPDGTFSCRFSLPDGEHVVTLSALSAQGDLRQAELRFGRHTDYRGEVGAAPQDQSVEPPEADSP